MGAIATDDDPHDDAEEVRLRLAARASNARLARLTVTALASRMAYSYDEIEDLRIAVGEVCGILFDPGPMDPGGTDDPGDPADPSGASSVEIVCTVQGDALRVQTTRSPGPPVPDVTDLNRQILESVADEVAFDLDPAAPTVTFTKRRRS